MTNWERSEAARIGNERSIEDGLNGDAKSDRMWRELRRENARRVELANRRPLSS